MKRTNVRYFDVELPEHAVILAEGLAVRKLPQLQATGRTSPTMDDPAIPDFVARLTPNTAAAVGDKGRGHRWCRRRCAPGGAADGHGRCATTLPRSLGPASQSPDRTILRYDLTSATMVGARFKTRRSSNTPLNRGPGDACRHSWIAGWQTWVNRRPRLGWVGCGPTALVARIRSPVRIELSVPLLTDLLFRPSSFSPSGLS